MSGVSGWHRDSPHWRIWGGARPARAPPRSANGHDVVDDAPDTLQTSLAACEQKLFPNIFLCLYLLMVVPVSTAATERSHSGLQIVKTKLQSTMGQQRLNALMLLYIHKDIQINYPNIIDIYANRYPRRMLFKNPLAEEQEEKQKSM